MFWFCVVLVTFGLFVFVFLVCGSLGSRLETIELKPNGREIAVTDANKHEYVRYKNAVFPNYLFGN